MSIQKTYEQAEKILFENSTKKGFLATSKNRDNYRRIWARDGVIQGIASLMSENNELIKTFKENLKYLKKFQDSKTGRIPSNVDLRGKKISYGTLVGKIDATIWYVIGVSQYYKYTKDKKFLNEFYASVEKAVNYLKSIELNGKGLLYVPTGGDWADEYITHGYVLFDQVLYFQALRDYYDISKKQGKKQKNLSKKIKHLKKLIQINYFPSETKLKNKNVYHKKLYKIMIKEHKKPYPITSFSSDGFYDYLDSFASSLILLINKNLIDKKHLNQIESKLISRLNKQNLKILPAFWPPITENNILWKRLKINSLFKFRNKPNKYQNGGLWPLIQGFFISSLIQQNKEKTAREYLEKFSDILEKDNYQFNEYYESKNYTAQGTEKLGFSAAGYIIAYLSVIEKKGVFK